MRPWVARARKARRKSRRKRRLGARAGQSQEGSGAGCPGFANELALRRAVAELHVDLLCKDIFQGCRPNFLSPAAPGDCVWDRVARDVRRIMNHHLEQLIEQLICEDVD
jgi:hypothetical protein